MLALDIKKITKYYNDKKGQRLKALDNISLTVEKGEIRGLLGPNGAGKTTLINLISGVNSFDPGSIEVFGIDVAKKPQLSKKTIGVVPQEIVVEMAFTVEEVLYYYGGMFGVPQNNRKQRIDEILTDLQLLDKKKSKARSLSGGMKRRLMIAKAMMHQPNLLILDEPTAGVDVALRQKIWELVRRLNKEGVTILFTTHYLEEAEQLCDRITMINKGVIVKDGNLREILTSYSKPVIHFELYDRNVEHLDQVLAIGAEYEYPIINLEQGLKQIFDFYKNNIKSIRNEAPSLERIFLELTSEK